MSMRILLFPLVAAVGCANSAQACDVRFARGENASGTVVMSAAEQSCGKTMLYNVDRQVPVSSMTLTAAPAHGTVAINGPAFAYAPKPGFKGQDRFVISATGRGTMILTRTMNVTVR